jgi:hypothetical protein
MRCVPIVSPFSCVPYSRAKVHKDDSAPVFETHRSIEYAPALGVSTLLGFIFAHNTPSLRLVEKHGFTRWGCLPRVAVLDGVERDLAILGRRVGSVA